MGEFPQNPTTTSSYQQHLAPMQLTYSAFPPATIDELSMSLYTASFSVCIFAPSPHHLLKGNTPAILPSLELTVVFLTLLWIPPIILQTSYYFSYLKR